MHTIGYTWYVEGRSDVGETTVNNQTAHDWGTQHFLQFSFLNGGAFRAAVQFWGKYTWIDCSSKEAFIYWYSIW